jgi:prepilin-type N-terminal cleavage/methylation domain-containing protein
VRRGGLTLLEVLVALAILSLVVAGYLELFHGGHVLLARSRVWTQAIAYASDGMERAKLGDRRTVTLPGGFRRQVTSAAWAPGIESITVRVTLPDGARFDLRALRAE